MPKMDLPGSKPNVAEEVADEFTHFVHLADGRVIRHFMKEPLYPHFEEDDGSGNITRTQIIGVYPK